MRKPHSRWWWLIAVVPAMVLMDWSTERLNRTGHIPQALWIGTSVTLAVSCLVVAIVLSRQYDSAAAEERREEHVSDRPIN